jgi:hypothetical protein
LPDLQRRRRIKREQPQLSSPISHLVFSFIISIDLAEFVNLFSMLSPSLQSADVIMAGDDFSLIDFTANVVPALAPTGADQNTETFSFDDYLTFPPQDVMDRFLHGSPTHPEYDMNDPSLISSSTSGASGVNMLPDFESPNNYSTNDS